MTIDPHVTAVPMKKNWQRVKKVRLKTIRNVQLQEPNVLVLDFAQYKTRASNGKITTGKKEVLRLDDHLRDILGVPHRGGDMRQPWARKSVGDNRSVFLTASFRFAIASLPTSPIYLAMETPGRFGVFLNETPVNTDWDEGWWVDPCLRKIPLDNAALRKGENTVKIQLDFRETDNIEAMFLLGNFKVIPASDGRCNTILGTDGMRLDLGDWTRQGLPFYGGSVVYTIDAMIPDIEKGQRLLLRVPDFEGTCLRLFIEGQEIAVLPWEPYEVDITPYIKNRKRIAVGVEVFGSRRNCFGPLHLAEKAPFAIGPGSFRTKGKNWVDAYVLHSYGLSKMPELIIQESR